MVLSRINASIEYKDKTKIENDDIKSNLILYKILIYNKYIINISIGKYNINKDVLFMPIYLFYNNNFISQIGIFEYKITKYNECLRDYGIINNGNVIINKLNEPIFYSFVTKDFIFKYKINIKNDNLKWFKTFMNDMNYNTIDINNYIYENDDCLFTAIKIALSYVKRYVSISCMKDKISNCVNKDVYDMYKNEFYNIEKELMKIKLYLKVLINKNKYYEDKIKNTNIRNEKILFIKELQENNELLKSTKRELKNLNEKYKNVLYMKDINKLEDLILFIKSDNFYGDMWSISMLETIMNIKIVLFSQDSYESGDIYNVLNCNSNFINKNLFNPDYYILISYKNNNYKLISYNNTYVFDFNNLNSSIKQLIINKIKERNCGTYEYIQNFMKYNKIVPTIQLQSDLYNGNTVFQIYKYSNDYYYPGKGIGESLDKREINKYKELHYFKSWRRKLSSLYDNFKSEEELKKHISHNKELQSILKNTHNAKIVFFIPKSPPIIANILMKIRKELNN